jgi:hypothetical protein
VALIGHGHLARVDAQLAGEAKPDRTLQVGAQAPLIGYGGGYPVDGGGPPAGGGREHHCRPCLPERTGSIVTHAELRREVNAAERRPNDSRHGADSGRVQHASRRLDQRRSDIHAHRLALRSVPAAVWRPYLSRTDEVIPWLPAIALTSIP